MKPSERIEEIRKHITNRNRDLIAPYWLGSDLLTAIVMYLDETSPTGSSKEKV